MERDSIKDDNIDNTIKNVVQELMREVTNKKLQVFMLFAIYFVDLLILNPTWGIKPGILPDRSYVMAFVKHCLKIFTKKMTPGLATLQMQWQFTENFEEISDAVSKNREDLKSRLAPLEKEIIECELDEQLEVDRLFKKIIYLVTLNSGLGNPTKAAVFDEAEAALRSIFTEDDLMEFLDQEPDEKEEQLVELTELVTGIRLFNRDCGKSGSGIEDLPKLLTQALEITISDVKKTLDALNIITDKLTTALDNCYKTAENDKFEYILVRRLGAEIEEEDLAEMKSLLAMYRQYELLVRKTMLEVNTVEILSKEKFEHLNIALKAVHETVQFKLAIPVVQVFPLFKDVCEVWVEIQNLTILLSQLNQTLLNLQVHSKDLTMNEEIVKVALGHMGALTEAERLEKTNNLRIEPALESEEVKLLFPDEISDYSKVELQYLGFCAWKFVETEGALIPGNPNIGILQVQSLNYVFSSPEAAIAFSKDPLRYILRGLKVARENPELINLLQLKEQLIVVRDIEPLVSEIPEETITYEVEAETVDHPIPTYIDKEYMWNIWDWKRQALMLGTLSRCQTHSSQTIFSNGWNCIRSQTVEMKDFTYQTKKDNYSNVPKLSNFIFGLRGRKDNKQHIITLTRPVDETPFVKKCDKCSPCNKYCNLHMKI